MFEFLKFFELDIAYFFLSKDFFTLLSLFAINIGFLSGFFSGSFSFLSWMNFLKYFSSFSFFFFNCFFDPRVFNIFNVFSFNFLFYEVLNYFCHRFNNAQIVNLIKIFQKQVFILLVIYQTLLLIFDANKDLLIRIGEITVFCGFLFLSYFIYKLRNIFKKMKKKSDLSFKIVNELYSSFVFILLSCVMFFYSQITLQLKFYFLFLNVLSYFVYRFFKWNIKIFFNLKENKALNTDLMNIFKLFNIFIQTLLNLIFISYVLILWKVNLYGYMVYFGEIVGENSLIKIVVLILLSFSSVLFFYLGNFLTKKWIEDKKLHSSVELSSRFETLFGILNILFKGFIYCFCALSFLYIIGINPAPFFANFWALTFGLSLGLQSLAKDFTSGLFIMFEDTFNIGDIVVVSGVTGKIEDITLRVLRIRDFEGGLHTIPFSQIDIVCNKSKAYIFVLFSIAVDTDAKTETVMHLIKEAGVEFKTQYPNDVLEDIQVIGPSEMLSGGIVYQARIKMKPINTRTVRPVYYEILKKKFDKHHIKLAYDILNFKHLFK